MNHSKLLFSGLVSLSLLALGACTSADTAVNETEKITSATKAERTQTGYIKPGASVDFSHNYDGKTEPGEVETFQVFIKGGSLARNIDVKMAGTDGLKIYSDTAAQKLSVAEYAPSGLDHRMNVSVGAQTPGRYYLNFTATSGQGEEKMMRAYGIAIQVGDQPFVPEPGTGMTVEDTPTGEKIITMEATETIEK